MTKYNFCWRTGRPCKPGAFDGGDGVSSSIDCASGDPVTCGWRGPQILNATPHPLRILARDEAGEIEGFEDDKIPRKYRIVAVIPPSGIVVRAATPQEEIVGSIPLGIPIPILKMALLGTPTGLPTPQEGTFIFVSRIAAEAAAMMKLGRQDLLFPGRYVRNQNGEVIGVSAFGRFTP
jgi:hypothetical protein